MDHPGYARLRSQSKYDREHTKGFYMKLNLKTDKDILQWMWKQQSVQGSIKRLIRNEIEKTGFKTVSWM